MEFRKKLTAIILTLAMMVSSWGVFGMSASYALDENAEEAVTEEAVQEDPAEADTQAEEPEAQEEEDEDTYELTGSETVEDVVSLPEGELGDVDELTEEELLEGYMMTQAAEKESDLERAPRVWNLSGKDLIYYNKIRELAQNVAGGGQDTTYIKFAGTQVLSKTKFTASELGLTKVAVKSNGKLVLTESAKNKIAEMLSPDSWSNVLTAVLLDMPYELYWYNRIDAGNCKYEVHYKADYTATTVTISTGSSRTYCEIMLPLIRDYAVKNGSQYDRYKVDISKTRAVEGAIVNARAIVEKHAAESDYDKLRSYFEEILEITAYDYSAAKKLDDPKYEDYEVYNSPWQLVSVFDGDESTKVVCAGYGKAYKFLCDLSSFRSNWIECQTIYGKIEDLQTANGGAHLWCTVRMNDGQNYIVDPTWADGSNGYDLFLQGGARGSDFCTVETTRRGQTEPFYKIKYTVNSTMKKIFSQSELEIALSDYDPETEDAPISVSAAKISTGSAVYTGEAVTDVHPVVKVDGRTLKEGTDYFVGGFSDNVNVGTASCMIVGMGQYSGSKEAEFSILPQRTSISKFVKGRKYFKVKWKKQSRRMSKARITGYQIQYSTSSTFRSGNKSVKVKGYKKVTRTIKGLKAKKTYYVRVRTYLKTGGKTYYSAWSPARKVKTR